MPSQDNDKPEIYIIPQNFIDTGTVFGGTIKLRNAIEAGIIVFILGYIILHLNITLYYKIIVSCITILPCALIAVIGINGESLTAFIINFFKFLKSRRIIGLDIDKSLKEDTTFRVDNENIIINTKSSKQNILKRSSKKGDVQVLGTQKNIKATTLRRTLNPVANYIPIKKVENGIVYTTDGRYIKILEAIPINFLLRNNREQRNIIYSFISFLKISPVKMQIKVFTKSADVNEHLEKIQIEFDKETDPKCKSLQEDYAKLIYELGSKNAITRKFYLIFEYEPNFESKGMDKEKLAISEINTAANSVRTYLRHCGNEIVSHQNENEFVVNVFYSLINRKTSINKPLSLKISEVMEEYKNKGWSLDLKDIPITEFIASKNIDFSHSSYIKIDDVYTAYMFIPSDGYKSKVLAAWTSLIVNAGEGIDLDIFFSKERKDKIQQKLGQQIRINRSKIKDTQDTNSDFEDLENAIHSGYYMKNGLSNNQDFYYANMLITITGDTVDEINWRVREMKKLLLSQDLNVHSCTFREEQSFLSALPLLKLDKELFNLSKRNMLTTGVASMYPFTSFEMCDNNGILLGVNRHNNSLIIVDIFNSKIYKNANMAILGTSGAGKTFTMQLMALRMRRKHIQTFIIAPLKGHEFYRACKNIGGEFIQISASSKNCINILEIRKVDNVISELIDEMDIEKSLLASKIQRVHIFFSLLIPDITHEERQLLDEALIITYDRKGITHDNDSLVDTVNPNKFKEMPILGDLYDVLLEKSETKRIANILARLVTGSAKTFNQHTNVNLNNKYTVLDISELTGDLLTVGMFVALDFVWDTAKEDRTKEKAIFIDETWQLIGASSNKLAAEFVLEIFKIIRGYGGSAICATQDLNDFFSLDDGKYGKGIINNSKTKIILNLEDEEAERVSKVMHLSEAEILEITHFERGNGLISTNNNNVTVEFKASKLETELITTDRLELRNIAESRKNVAEF